MKRAPNGLSYEVSVKVRVKVYQPHGKLLAPVNDDSEEVTFTFNNLGSWNESIESACRAFLPASKWYRED